MSGGSGGQPVYRPAEMSLLCSETDGQMQRALKGLHEALLSRQTELLRSARAFGGAKGSLELRRRRLQDELRHNAAMAGKAARRGDSEEAAYRAGQAGQLRQELAVAEAEFQARLAAGCREVNQELLAAMFAEAADEFTEQLVAEMRATADRVAERDVREMAAEENFKQ